jgi:hypothetical protein
VRNAAAARSGQGSYSVTIRLEGMCSHLSVRAAPFAPMEASARSGSAGLAFFVASAAEQASHAT